MGLAGGATADDAEVEYIRHITEKDIVTGKLSKLFGILISFFFFFWGGGHKAKKC